MLEVASHEVLEVLEGIPKTALGLSSVYATEDDSFCIKGRQDYRKIGCNDKMM